MNDLAPWLEWLLAAMLVIGGVFTLVGAVGMVRFPDFYMRLHAPTKATTLGVGALLGASLGLSWLEGRTGVHEFLIVLLLFVTAPVSANLMAKAALHLRVPTRAAEPTSLRRD